MRRVTARRLGLRRAALAAAALVAGSAVVACTVFTPLPAVTGLDDRLAAFPTNGLPLDRPVTIRWDDHQIPFVEAETDAGAAFAMGMVHAHLRLGQLGVVRRIVQGRLSESVGPLTVEIDHAVRTLDFYRAADAILAALPSETRLWMDRYVDGLNHYAAIQIARERPHEFVVLDIAWEPWTERDSIALGRAGGVDLNWEFLLRMLSIEDPALLDAVATRVLRGDRGGVQRLAQAPEAMPQGALQPHGVRGPRDASPTCRPRNRRRVSPHPLRRDRVAMDRPSPPAEDGRGRRHFAPPIRLHRHRLRAGLHAAGRPRREGGVGLGRRRRHPQRHDLGARRQGRA